MSGWESDRELSSEAVQTDSEVDPSDARWPEHLADVCGRAHGTDAPARATEARANAWMLIRAALLRYLRLHAARGFRFPAESLEDLASEKSLDLLAQFDSRQWQPQSRDRAGIRGFLSTVARNGLVDATRREARHARVIAREESGLGDSGHEPTWLDGSRSARSSNPPSPGLVSALRECVLQLAPRSRFAWFFRVFYQMSSREIGAHPALGIEPAHVDVVVQRARRSLKECLQARGIEGGELPPGAFAAIHEVLRPSVLERKAETEKERG